jgi:hypothetical protein
MLRDAKPQVRQYAVKALKAYGTASKCALSVLRDLAISPVEPEYNNRDAKLAAETIEEALRTEEKQAAHCCQRCVRRTLIRRIRLLAKNLPVPVL